MSLIKNRLFEEINRKPDRLEDEEFFYEKSQKVMLNLKPQNGHGKEKQGDQDHQIGQKR
jgi:hypothetical protein